ncbi:hypothetical protein C6P46_002988 [Rhodotorula mucilaginosa]|uniref:Uncharacterized protein n=1 Tax=Rhodotorula mucilaginosa TaxID=5537 RepID=A0A9P6W3N2_RHOMI|nr:hypothetical protein C6P46_002988 [Rhodotorula mucilaginosa]
MGATSRFCLPSLRSAWCRYARARIATLRVAVLTDRNVVHGRERRRCPASGSAATGPSTETAPATTSSRAHGSTAVAQPAYPGPLALYQRNPYVLKLSGINPDLTTDDARAIATFLRATCFARVDTLLYLTCDGQLEFFAAWSCSRNEEFRRRQGLMALVLLRALQGIGTISEAFLPYDIDLLSQKLQAVDRSHPASSARDASST